jgi:HD-like signal output (HDOD) protein
MPHNDSLLDQIVRLIESGRLGLPAYDPVVLRLQKAVANQSEDIDEIEQLIVKDQALAAEVLRASNSPFYCALSPVRSIRNAIVRLGIQQIRRLVILVSERTKYKAHHPTLYSLLIELWKHASTTALAAQWLSKRLHSTGIEEICFLGGLLHDIGKLAILRATDELIKKEKVKQLPPIETLNEILLTAHCRLGYNLLQGWNIPGIYCQIARDHHNEKIPPGELPLAIVRLANEGSRKLGLGLDPNPSLDLAETLEARLLNVDEELLSELQVMIEDHISIAA